jgi:branched-chain amino acid transport system permease protein
VTANVERTPIQAPMPDSQWDRPSGIEATKAFLDNSYLRLFVASELSALLLAVMTGPQGSAEAPTSGFSGSFAQPRVWEFVAFGVVLFGIRVGWSLWGRAIKAFCRTAWRLAVRAMSHLLPRMLLEALLIAAGFGWVTWLAPHDTWKGGVCIEIGAALFVTELVVWLFQHAGAQWARVAAYGGAAAYGALAWMTGSSSGYLNGIGAVPHNAALGRFLMVVAAVLCGLELVCVPIATVNRRVTANLPRKLLAAAGVSVVLYGWFQWTTWSQWSQVAPGSVARWLAAHHLLVHDHTSGLVVMFVGALGLLSVVAWILVEARAAPRRGAGDPAAAALSVRRITPIGFGRPALLVAILLIVLQWPLHMDPGSQSNIDLQIMPLALLALGLNVVIGFAGLLDLGYAAFYAIGAYMTGYFTGTLPIHPPFTLNPFWVIPIAILAAMLAGVVLGTPTLRLRGDYLAIVTLGFGEVAYIYATSLTSVTGGSQGAPGQVPSFSFHLTTPWLTVNEAWSAITYVPTYYLTLGVVLLSMLVFHFLKQSRVGRSWAALREDETAADSLGVNALKYRVMAFAIGASTGGFAGIFLGTQTGSIFPTSFIVQVSITVVVCVVFGGMGSIAGAVVGAIVVGGLPAYLTQNQGHWYTSWYNPLDLFIYLGALLVVMTIFRPQGIIPSRQRRREIELVESGSTPRPGPEATWDQRPYVGAEDR